MEDAGGFVRIVQRITFVILVLMAVILALAYLV